MQTASAPKSRPDLFCSLHEKALASLTADWQSFSALHKATGLDKVAFDDLRWWGFAEEHQELLSKNGIATGSRFFIRLVQA